MPTPGARQEQHADAHSVPAADAHGYAALELAAVHVRVAHAPAQADAVHCDTQYGGAHRAYDAMRPSSVASSISSRCLQRSASRRSVSQHSEMLPPAETPPAHDPEEPPAADGVESPLSEELRSICLELDQMILEALGAGHIRLVRVRWLRERPAGYRIERRQALEERERHGESPLLSPTEAVALVRRSTRCVGVLTYGW